jgi:hypothetical protein
MKYLYALLLLGLSLICGARPASGIDVQAYPAIDLIQLPSDDIIYANVKEDARGPYYLTIVRRPDGIYEKGILRFQCKVDQMGADVCAIGPKAYTFIAWYMRCDRSGDCEDEVTLHEKVNKVDTAFNQRI